VERAGLLRLAEQEREVKAQIRKVRCVIYTRVSTGERLDMEFNRLDAQREAALRTS
jgi:predicted site-specific integrase-resolvase